jgi:hypothetical protein
MTSVIQALASTMLPNPSPNAVTSWMTPAVVLLVVVMMVRFLPLMLLASSMIRAVALLVIVMMVRFLPLMLLASSMIRAVVLLVAVMMVLFLLAILLISSEVPPTTSGKALLLSALQPTASIPSGPLVMTMTDSVACLMLSGPTISEMVLTLPDPPVMTTMLLQVGQHDSVTRLPRRPLP